MKKWFKTGEVLDILNNSGVGEVRAFMKDNRNLYIHRTEEGVVWGHTGQVVTADPYTMNRLWEVVEMQFSELFVHAPSIAPIPEREVVMQ